MRSRLPLPAAEANAHPDVLLSDPEDNYVYLIRASGLQSRLAEPLSSSSRRLEELNPKLDIEVGEKELRTASFTTNEEADRVWHVIQKENETKTDYSRTATQIYYTRQHTSGTTVTSNNWPMRARINFACMSNNGGREDLLWLE